MSSPIPQVVVRGEAYLLVEPELADVGVTSARGLVTGTPHWSGAPPGRRR